MNRVRIFIITLFLLLCILITPSLFRHAMSQSDKMSMKLQAEEMEKNMNIIYERDKQNETNQVELQTAAGNIRYIIHRAYLSNSIASLEGDHSLCIYGSDEIEDMIFVICDMKFTNLSENIMKDVPTAGALKLRITANGKRVYFEEEVYETENAYATYQPGENNKVYYIPEFKPKESICTTIAYAVPLDVINEKNIETALFINPTGDVDVSPEACALLSFNL